MIGKFSPGQTVTVFLAPGLRVPRSPQTPNQMIESGQEVTWNDWIHNKVAEGSLLLTDPRKEYRAGKAAEEKPAPPPASAPTSEAPAAPALPSKSSSFSGGE